MIKNLTILILIAMVSELSGQCSPPELSKIEITFCTEPEGEHNGIISSCQNEVIKTIDIDADIEAAEMEANRYEDWQFEYGICGYPYLSNGELEYDDQIGGCLYDDGHDEQEITVGIVFKGVELVFQTDDNEHCESPNLVESATFELQDPNQTTWKYDFQNPDSDDDINFHIGFNNFWDDLPILFWEYYESYSEQIDAQQWTFDEDTRIQKWPFTFSVADIDPNLPGNPVYKKTIPFFGSYFNIDVGQGMPVDAEGVFYTEDTDFEFNLKFSWRGEQDPIVEEKIFTLVLKLNNQSYEEPSTSTCLGDLNTDNNFNVMDLVALAACVLIENCNNGSSGDGSLASDLNLDNEWDILDIVILANCILTGTCCEVLENDDNCEQCVE